MTIRQDTKNQDEHVLNLRVGLRKRECKSINELNLLPVTKESEKENTKKRVDKTRTCVGSW